jgi:hypothetical protein
MEINVTYVRKVIYASEVMYALRQSTASPWGRPKAGAREP